MNDTNPNLRMSRGTPAEMSAAQAELAGQNASTKPAADQAVFDRDLEKLLTEVVGDDWILGSEAFELLHLLLKRDLGHEPNFDIAGAARRVGELHNATASRLVRERTGIILETLAAWGPEAAAAAAELIEPARPS